MIFTQTDGSQTVCDTAAELGPSTTTPDALFTASDVVVASNGGTVGTGTASVSITASNNGFVVAGIKVDVPAGTTWDAGNWTVRLNVTTANMNITLTNTIIYRVSSACTFQETLGTDTTDIDLSSTGVKTATVTTTAATPSVGDFVFIVFTAANGAMSDQTAVITKDQNIDSPFTAAAGPITVTPGAGSETYTGQTPVPFVLAPVTTTPGAGSETYTGQAPSVQESIVRSPGAGSETYTGQAPTESVTTNVFISGTAGSETYTGQAPTEAVTANVFRSPGAGSETYTGQTPTPGEQVFRQPDAGAVTYTGQAPTLVAGDNRVTQPDAGAVVYGGQVPVFVVGDNQIVVPNAGEIIYGGLAPAVVISGETSEVVKTGTGGGDYTRRIVKPVPFLGKGKPKVEERVDETREIHAEVVGQLARELGEIEDVEPPVTELTMFEVDQEIGRLLRKVRRTQNEEILLLMLLAVA